MCTPKPLPDQELAELGILTDEYSRAKEERERQRREKKEKERR